ncbi:hypothetical protein GDO81_024651 [Engystomops pustulosus]|uniref:Secreted protein n=1 Tax=Engystomops pustulosus TaxID=76066 RepID=A0AAV6ZMZ1_ENGPU|nr:hypothetical protein GDO81_024651 [Engystomops pustulosus]
MVRLLHVMLLLSHLEGSQQCKDDGYSPVTMLPGLVSCRFHPMPPVLLPSLVPLSWRKAGTASFPSLWRDCMDLDPGQMCHPDLHSEIFILHDVK